jgi:ribulose-5-phosphate 4-epimerase/fuculose-1-phosphate aldolase
LVSVADILEFDLDSRPVDGKARALYQERFIHGEIYKARPDVMAVVHNHSPALIPFGMTNTTLRPAYHMSAFVGQGIPVFEIRTAGGNSTDMLVKTPALGRALAQSLGGHPAALLRGHGAVVVGASLPYTVARSIYLQMNANLQAAAMTLGHDVTYLNSDEARNAEVTQGDYARAWDLWKRKVMGKERQ